MGLFAHYIGRAALATGLILSIWCASAALGATWGAALGPGVLARQAQRVEEPSGEPGPAESPAPAPTPRAREPGRAGAMPGWLAVVALLTAGAAVWWIARRGLADPSPSNAEAPPLTGARGMIPWPLMMLAALLVWLAQPLGAASAGALFGLSAADGTTLRGAALAALGSSVGALIAAAVSIAATPGLAREIGVRPTGQGAVRGLGAFCLIMPIVFAVAVASMSLAGWIARLRGGPPPEELAHGTLRLLAEPGAGDGLWWVLTVIAVVIGAPVFEELVYRGLFQSGLRGALSGGKAGRRAASWGAIAGSSVVFALMHASIAEPHALPTLLVLSVALGVVYGRTGRLVAPIVVHGLFNAANIALVWLPA